MIAFQFHFCGGEKENEERLARAAAGNPLCPGSLSAARRETAVSKALFSLPRSRLTQKFPNEGESRRMAGRSFFVM